MTALGAALLFAAEPGDRALAGWSPQGFVRLQFGLLMETYGFRPPEMRGAGVTGGIWACNNQHEPVLWAGTGSCWFCGGRVPGQGPS